MNVKKEKILSDGIRKKDSPSGGRTARASEPRVAAPRARPREKPDDTLHDFLTDAPSRTEKPAIIVGERINNERRDTAQSRGRFALLGIMGAIAAIAAIAVLVSTIGASTTLTIKPRVDEITLQDIQVHFDITRANASPGDKTIPAERLLLTKDIRREFAATATEEVSARAHAKVKIVNQFSSSPQLFVRSTRFATDTGIVFRSIQPITVPGAKIEAGAIVPQFIEAELAADSPGEGANISGEVKMHLPGLKGSAKYDGFYAVASQGSSGGASGRLRVASAEDIARAEESVTKEASDALEAEMAQKIPQGLTYEKALREIQITRVDAPKPHTPGDKFFVSVSARGRALAFRASDVNAIIKAGVIGTDQTREMVEHSEDIRYQVQSADFDLGRADALIRGSVRTKAVISRADLGAAIAGKKEGSITNILKSRPEVAGFTVTFFPPWRSSAPGDPAKIHLIIQ